MKKSELREYWESYGGKKVKYTAFYERVKRAWFTKEKAIKPVSKFLKTKKLLKCAILEFWRECTKCHQIKPWDLFTKDKNSKMWYTPSCSECRNKIKQEKRKKEPSNYEKDYKAEFRKTERWIKQTKLDTIYYRDPVIKKNREILKKIKWVQYLKSISKQSKFEYFVNKWYSKEELKFIYNIK